MNRLVHILSNGCRLLLSILLLFVTFNMLPAEVKGETLGDLKAKLNKKIEEYNAANEQKQLTNAQINSAQNEISEIAKTIEQNRITISELEEQIKHLNEEIEKKDSEIKEIMKFYQISSGTATYLEYIFGAKDFTDLIYRMAVSEQLVNYNDNLIDEYNKIVEDSKSKQQELSNKEVELKQEQTQMEQKLKTLGNQLSKFSEQTVSIEEEIKVQKEAIKIYEEQYKCKDEDEISKCTTNQLPLDTSFWRPLKYGIITSDYGYRTYWLNGKKVSDFHTGIDLSLSPTDNVPVYSSAAGIVIATIKKSSCGGNQIYIHHNINGKTYTTGYVHLRAMNVSVGDVVTKDTQIGVMGGNPRIETWDKCSTGAHLHFAISTGLYFKDYSSWSSYVSHTFNPISIVNFPSGSRYFYDRTTKY